MSWASIQGHERWVAMFARVVEQRRLAHAYLFVGPEGVGKRLFALELAKTLLCEGRGDRFEACGTCAACALVEAQTHPDLFLTGMAEDENELSIESMREFSRNFSLKTARGKGKVGVLDDADHLNEASANCFLKTLEEPPAGSVLILLATSREGQMPTILSRCQTVRFAPLPETTVRELLRGQGVEAGLGEAVARLAGGSPGQALALADAELWQFRKTLIQGLTQAPIDTVALGKAWAQFAEEAGKEAPAQRRRVALVLRLLLDFFREALAVSVGGAGSARAAGDREILHRWSERTAPEKIMALIERALESERQLERYIQVTLVLEALLDAFGQIANPRVPVRT